ncbi:longevity-assurance protein domain-containing protein [Cystoisospora suis]|uniref:Longevity-assurance protein domain-containing protein n=1 Tax=Cystoisospora suis TaxID=483139 RepID=A0A2C6LBP4_9APIC|nr:longevity-assurance protein domain-containing protein [Cystoisospora suis]
MAKVYRPLNEDLRQFTDISYDADGSVVRYALSYFEHLKERVSQGDGQLSTLNLYLLNPTLDWDDVYFFLGMTVALCLGRLFVSGAMIPSWRNSFSVFKYIANKGQIAKPGKVYKLAENLWYCCWHTTAFLWGMYLLMGEAGTPEAPGWVRKMWQQTDGRWYWITTDAEFEQGSIGWPLLVPSSGIRTYYLTQASFWTSCLVFLRFETRRSDFHVMATHHIATVALVGFSYALSYWRLGHVVLVLHDWVDVLLYCSKSLQYSFIPPRVTDCSFVCFVISYLVARLILFPIYCVWPTIDPTLTHRLSHGRVTDHHSFPGGVALPVFLCVLVGLHIYWFGLIIRMVYRMFRDKREGIKKEISDIRSDDESESTATTSTDTACTKKKK